MPAFSAPLTRNHTRRAALITGQRDGEARRRRPAPAVATQKRSSTVERGAVREERGRVAVAAEAEQDEVEDRQLARAAAPGRRGRAAPPRRRAPPPAGSSSPRMRCTFSGGMGTCLMKRLARHAVVAGRVVRRHAALVAPVELDAAPGDLLAELLARQHAVQGARRLAAAQGGGEAAARRRAPPAPPWRTGRRRAARGPRRRAGPRCSCVAVSSSPRPAPGVPVGGDQRRRPPPAPSCRPRRSGSRGRLAAATPRGSGSTIRQASSTWSPRLNSVMSPSMASTSSVS